ncbi:MAG: hypothetical protein RL748_3590, partial [Pseudomonadota bacterium]
LHAHPTESQTHFLLGAWLNIADKLGDVAMGQEVGAAVKAWLAVFARYPVAGYVTVAWLNASQVPALVKDAVSHWLTMEKNRIAPEAHFVVKAWLDAKQDAGVVKDALIAWLAVEQNCIASGADFVFKAWLNAKQSHALIEPHVLAWLAHANNAINLNAHFLYRAWGNQFNRLDDFMFGNTCRWIQAHSNHPDAAFAMRWVIADRRLDKLTTTAIIDWLTNFPTHEDAPGRLSRLHIKVLSHCPNEVLTTLYATVLANYIKSANHFGEFDVKTACFLFFNAVRIAKRPTLHPPSRVPLARLFCQFLRQLSTTQIQHIKTIIINLVGGALPGLIRLGLQHGETFDAPLANATRQLMQAYASLGELGASDATLLRQIVEKQPGRERGGDG